MFLQRFVMIGLFGSLVHAQSQCHDTIPSACANGGYASDQQYGFSCPQMMMFSPAMMTAVQEASLSPTRFVFATAGGSRDGECGMCFQVQVLDAERQWRDDFPLLVVQIINSGFDVLPHQLDLFMAGGGFGYFTSCNGDCSQRYCQGGPCRQSMYSTSFSSWIQPEFNDPNPCYAGGVKWLQDSNTTYLKQLCQGLIGDEDVTLSEKARSTFDSCVLSNTELFHQNFVASRVARVQCPMSLVHVTGLHRLDDADYPFPDEGITYTDTCQGDRTQGRYCITTMQDCCKPSCAWSGKIPSQAFDATFPCIYTCDRSGQPYP